MSDDIVSLEEICGFIGVGDVEVYTWISTRKMPARLIGGAWKFSKADVEVWLDQSGVRAELAQAPSSAPPAR